MKLSRYFFRQFFPPFMFGAILFLFVLVLDKLFDLLDLIFNKGVSIALVGKLFILIVPTVLPLTIPMASIMACLVTFGRLSEENELTAVRAAGISLPQALFLPPLFALIVSILMVPLNTQVSPRANRAFIDSYEELVQAEPLISITPRKFFSLKNIQLFADSISSDRKEMNDVFVYQLSEGGAAPQRIYAHKGSIEAEKDSFHLHLQSGQIQKLDSTDPRRLTHTSFASYDILIPLSMESKSTTTRFRNFTSAQLREQISELKKQGFSVAPLRAEANLRWALAFAPLCLTLVGIPLATSLKKGSRSFSFGVTIVVIFAYYLLLILGLTLAEKAIVPPPLALWVGNFICLGTSAILTNKLMKT